VIIQISKQTYRQAEQTAFYKITSFRNGREAGFGCKHLDGPV
jgi:hypothetical protein